MRTALLVVTVGALVAGGVGWLLRVPEVANAYSSRQSEVRVRTPESNLAPES